MANRWRKGWDLNPR